VSLHKLVCVFLLFQAYHRLLSKVDLALYQVLPRAHTSTHTHTHMHTHAHTYTCTHCVSLQPRNYHVESWEWCFCLNIYPRKVVFAWSWVFCCALNLGKNILRLKLSVKKDVLCLNLVYYPLAKCFVCQNFCVQYHVLESGKRCVYLNLSVDKVRSQERFSFPHIYRRFMLPSRELASLQIEHVCPGECTSQHKLALHQFPNALVFNTDLCEVATGCIKSLLSGDWGGQ